MIPTLFIGIDPGASGGIACLYHHGVADVHKMPETERDVWDLIYSYRINKPGVYAMIEKVHAMPKNGSVSGFKLGYSYGLLRGCLIGDGVPFDEVTPQKWQKYMGCQKRDKSAKPSEHKNNMKAKAQQLFPELKITLATCDALLIAEYARRTHGQLETAH